MRTPMHTRFIPDANPMRTRCIPDAVCIGAHLRCRPRCTPPMHTPSGPEAAAGDGGHAGDARAKGKSAEVFCLRIAHVGQYPHDDQLDDSWDCISAATSYLQLCSSNLLAKGFSYQLDEAHSSAYSGQLSRRRWGICCIARQGTWGWMKQPLHGSCRRANLSPHGIRQVTLLPQDLAAGPAPPPAPPPAKAGKALACTKGPSD